MDHPEWRFCDSGLGAPRKLVSIAATSREAAVNAPWNEAAARIVSSAEGFDAVRAGW